MEKKAKKNKVIKAVKIAVSGAVEFAKSFAFGYCLGAGVLLTALAVEAKRTDSHLEWTPNK